MPTNTISKTKTPNKPRAASSNRALACRPTKGAGGKFPASTKVEEKKVKDDAPLSEVASSANQGAGTAKKVSSLTKNTLQFSDEAKDIMNGARAGADGSMRPRELGSALWDAFNTTEGAGGSAGAKGLALDAALTPVGMVNGVKGTKDAIGQIQNGQLSEGGKGLLLDGGGLVGDSLGAVDTAASAVEQIGKLGTRLPQGPASAAASKVAGVAPQAGRIASVSGKASGVIGGAVAVAEGAFQVREGLKEDDKAKAGRGAAKSLAGGMMLAGTVTGNPLLVGAGGLTYAGVSIYENREKIGRAAATSAKFVSSAAESVKDRAVETATERARTVANAAQSVLGWVS